MFSPLFKLFLYSSTKAKEDYYSKLVIQKVNKKVTFTSPQLSAQFSKIFPFPILCKQFAHSFPTTPNWMANIEATKWFSGIGCG